jgi:hypothetical protein
MFIAEVNLLAPSIQFFTAQREEVTLNMRQSLLARFSSPVWRAFLRISDVSRIATTLGQFWKQNTAWWSLLMRTRPERIPQQRAYCVYSIVSIVFSANVIKLLWWTDRALVLRFREHRHNMRVCAMETLVGSTCAWSRWSNCLEWVRSCIIETNNNWTINNDSA